MNTTPCPECGLPRSSEELSALPCPVCEFLPAKAEAPQAAAPLPVPEPPAVTTAEPPAPKKRRWPVFAAIGFVLLLNLGVAAFFLWPREQEQLADNGVSPTLPQPVLTTSPKPAPPEPAKPSPQEQPPKTGVKLSDIIPMPEEIPAPRVAVVDEPKKPEPKPNEVVEGDVRVLDRPDGAYTVEALEGDETVVLKGEVETLIVEHVAGKSTLDATALKVKKIIVKGKVEGAGTLDVKAPKVEFLQPLTGGSRTKITGEEVVFSEKIGGGAHLEIRGKEVEFKGTLQEGAQVKVCLESNGKLKHGEMTGGAQIQYRKANSADADPKIEGGDIREGAKVIKQEKAD